MSILSDKNVIVNVTISEFLDHAFAWGKEDALEGNSLYTGLNYFPLGSLAWQSYVDGHKAGTALKAILTGKPVASGAVDPLCFEMELEALRNGQVKPLATPYQVDDERIGAEISEAPYAW